MKWYLEVLRKYAQFDGRAHRAEYWFFALFTTIAVLVLSFIDGMLGMTGPQGMGLLSGLYWLAVLLPSIGVSIRRLHDTDRSGWWLLIALIPVVGTIAMLVFMVLPGTEGSNRFGNDPRGGMSSVVTS